MSFYIDVRFEGIECLRRTLAIPFHRYSKGSVGYRIDPLKGMIFFWHETAKDITPLPFRMNPTEAADFAARWLEDTAVYGPEPDHDGHNRKGWRVYADSWGHVADEPYSIVAVAPHWMEYGK